MAAGKVGDNVPELAATGIFSLQIAYWKCFPKSGSLYPAHLIIALEKSHIGTLDPHRLTPITK